MLSHRASDIFHTAFPPAVPLHNSGFKGDPLAFGRLEGDGPRSDDVITAVVSAALALALLIALVPGRLGQFQHFVESFLYAFGKLILAYPKTYPDSNGTFRSKFHWLLLDAS